MEENQIKLVEDPSQLSLFNDPSTQQQQAPVAPAPQQQAAPQQVSQAPAINDEAVVGFLSEKLGRSIKSIDELAGYMNRPQAAEVDERVKAINEFVKTTKRSPEDWFKYQSYDPDKMDELSLLKANLALDHPSLSAKEIDTLAKSKYKIGKEDMMDDDELEMHKLSLKVEAEAAKSKLQKIRSDFAAPQTGSDDENPFDERWMSEMERNAKDIEALEFQLPSGEIFSYGIDDAYKPTMIEQNKRIDQFFDQYVNGGKWDFEKLNAHRALIDNIDKIVASAYNQGISAGQRGVVTQHANVTQLQPKTPQTPPTTSEKVAAQIREALGSDMVTFKF